MRLADFPNHLCRAFRREYFLAFHLRRVRSLRLYNPSTDGIYVSARAASNDHRRSWQTIAVELVASLAGINRMRPDWKQGPASAISGRSKDGRTLQPIDNPFGPGVSPMSSVHSVTYVSGMNPRESGAGEGNRTLVVSLGSGLNPLFFIYLRRNLLKNPDLGYRCLPLPPGVYRRDCHNLSHTIRTI